MDAGLIAACAEASPRKPALLVTVVATKGSAPRHAGSKMLVRPGEPLLGTVGGGRVEAAALERAAAMAAQGPATDFVEVEMLGEAALGADMICGGSSSMLVERLDGPGAYRAARALLDGGRRALLVKRLPPAGPSSGFSAPLETAILDEGLAPASASGQVPAGFDPGLARKALATGKPVLEEGTRLFYDPLFPEEKLVILGGGHVGLALARLAAELDFKVTVVDDREEIAQVSRFPEGVEVLRSDYAVAVASLPFDPATYAVVLTRSHVHDLESARALMMREWRYAGMIGSARKTRLILEQLRNEGVPEARLGAFCAPIGLDIDAETPGEIAISILGEMIAVRRNAKALPALAASREARRG